MNQTQLYPYFAWAPITAMTVEKTARTRLIFHRPPPFVTFPEANSLSKDAPKLDEARAMYSVLAKATRNPSARSPWFIEVH